MPPSADRLSLRRSIHGRVAAGGKAVPDTARVDELYRRHARFYDATRRFILPDRRAAVEWLDVRAGDRVIDFACGTGLNVSHLRRSSPARITGIDCSDAMLQRAARKLGDVHLVLGDAATVTLPATAERIVCTYGLSMMDDWRDAVRNMHRHLTPDGVLVILDFHPLRGPAAPFDPILHWWLGRFGVRSETDFEPLLRELFRDVEVRVRPLGYDVLVRASRPRPAPGGRLGSLPPGC
jgi:ubiquinone/menaquinone biosynthesis C-methylase UbiE